MSDRRLQEYGRKRKFTQTTEPRAGSGREPGRKLELVPRARRAAHRFCVQEHHATRLHYDLRLEIDGVLKSWAVPKGPTLDPEVRRLAMATEDHPLDYLTFEGRIPEGNYGAGEVIVWDIGDYEPLGDAPPLKQWERGHLKFLLHGKKLQGEFALTHVAARGGDGRNRREERPENAWLLIKKHDQAGRYGDAAGQHPGSVLHAGDGGGPRLVEAGAGERKKRGEGGGERGERREGREEKRQEREEKRQEREENREEREEREAGTGGVGLPRPMLASLGERPFRDSNWVFEIKWDGIRALVPVRRGRARLVSRTGHDLTPRYPELARFPGEGKSRRAGWRGEAILDGEIVALDESGRPDFHRLQQRMNLSGSRDVERMLARVPVDFYAFDLLSLDGADLTGKPLLERKQRLARLPWSPPWRYSDHVVCDGLGLMAAARERNLEGIVAKRADSTYESGRSRQWIKFKLQQRQETVIVGYTDPQGSRTGFGALLLAVYDKDKRDYVYAGRAGTGFDAATRADLLARMQPASKPPVRGVPRGSTGAHWVTPSLVAEVRFAEWTPAGLMRAPVFLGLRLDKKPEDCVRESPDA